LFSFCFFPKEFTYHPCVRYVNTIMLFLSPVYHMSLPWAHFACILIIS
jgi:hypothetical protein